MFPFEQTNDSVHGDDDLLQGISVAEFVVEAGEDPYGKAFLLASELDMNKRLRTQHIKKVELPRIQPGKNPFADDSESDQAEE